MSSKKLLQSMDIAEEKRAQLKGLFPEVFSEDKIDFGQLKRVLGGVVEPGKERFGLTWPGKAECMKIIQQPSIANLKPARDESVNFDATENLFIEGDNLEVLKLLQRSYFGKVKMIYIDPPYNTGKEFIYPDKYSETLATYLAYTGQIDNDGHKFSTNTDSIGRYHSNWLNMMYPRLYLAKNLLREDGVIFISIDDNEVANLRKICDEMFGEENFITTFGWEKKKKPSFLNKNLGTKFEYICAYAKIRSETSSFSVDLTTEGKKYPFNNAGNSLATLRFPAGSVKFNIPDNVISPQDMSEGKIKTKLLSELKIVNGTNADVFCLQGEWRYSQTKLDEIVDAGEEIVISKMPFRPNHTKKGGEIKKMHNLLSIAHYKIATNEDADSEQVDLMGASFFDYSKPVGLINFITKAFLHDDEDALIVDFFAGSGTSAHACMLLNQKRNSNHKYIMVQLPERLDNKKTEQKAAYKFCVTNNLPINIAEISKERIRRAAKKIKEEQKGNNNLDLGFKVFKLAPSNFKVWEGDIEKIDNLEEQLEMHIDHVNSASTPEDILYELLLKAGFPLTTKVEKITMANKAVFSIEDGRMLICLDKELNQAVIDAMAGANPLQVICLDEGFSGNDQLKVNAVTTFKALSQDEESEIQFKTV